MRKAVTRQEYYAEMLEGWRGVVIKGYAKFNTSFREDLIRLQREPAFCSWYERKQDQLRMIASILDHLGPSPSLELQEQAIKEITGLVMPSH